MQVLLYGLMILGLGVVGAVIYRALSAPADPDDGPEDEIMDKEHETIRAERDAALRELALQRAATHAAERALVQANVDLAAMRKESVALAKANTKLTADLVKLLTHRIEVETADVTDPPSLLEADAAVVVERREAARRELLTVHDREAAPIGGGMETGWEGEDGG